MDLGIVFNLRELGFNLSGKASSGKLGPTGERHANAPMPASGATAVRFSPVQNSSTQPIAQH